MWNIVVFLGKREFGIWSRGQNGMEVRTKPKMVCTDFGPSIL
jgi:hypothetical protein